MHLLADPNCSSPPRRECHVEAINTHKGRPTVAATGGRQLQFTGMSDMRRGSEDACQRGVGQSASRAAPKYFALPHFEPLSRPTVACSFALIVSANEQATVGPAPRQVVTGEGAVP